MEEDNKDEYLVNEINKIIENIPFTKYFKELELYSIRHDCQIEYDFILKEIEKGSELNTLLLRFDKSVNERTLKNITENNKSEYIECLKLFLDFYKNELKREYLKLN